MSQQGILQQGIMDADEREDVLQSIRKKLRTAGVRVETIIKRCQTQDRNEDNVIHVDDLEAVLRGLLVIDPRRDDNMPTKRELRQLFSMMSNSHGRGEVEYPRLLQLLEPAATRRGDGPGAEHWRDEESGGRGRGRGAGGREKSVSIRQSDPDYWATSRGSVGEWLANAACPAEIKNFKRFITCMEKFERDSGVKIGQLDGGDFVIPLGPDFKVTMTFSTGGV